MDQFMNNYYGQQPMMGGMYGGYNPGMGYTGVGYNAMNLPKGSATLSEEEIKDAQKLANPQQTIKPTAEETYKAICSHYYPNGSHALVQVPGTDSLYRCSICQAIIDFSDSPSLEEVEELTRRFTNIQQIAKFTSYNMGDSVKRQYFQGIAYNEKLPFVWKNCNEVLKNINTPQQYNTNGFQGMQLFSAINQGYAPGFGGMPMQQPMGQPAPQVYQQPQPMMYGQPMQAAPVGANPFLQQPMMAQGVNPAFAGGYMAPGYQAAAPVPQAAPAAPAVDTTATTAAPADTATTVKQTNL